MHFLGELGFDLEVYAYWKVRSFSEQAVRRCSSGSTPEKELLHSLRLGLYLFEAAAVHGQDDFAASGSFYPQSNL